MQRIEDRIEFLRRGFVGTERIVTTDLDREFLERRYRQSLERAEKALDPTVASIHRELAARYAQRAAELEQANRSAGDTPV